MAEVRSANGYCYFMWLLTDATSRNAHVIAENIIAKAIIIESRLHLAYLL